MDQKVLVELWGVLTGLTVTRKFTILAIFASIVGLGFAVGRWSSKHTRAEVVAQNTILKNKLENLEEKNESVSSLL